MLVTLFGDVVSQHGGWIWLGSLISTMQPLGYSERLVRTSVYRLVQEDWFKVHKVGRKSYYSFTELALKHYSKAAKRIYAADPISKNNQWLIVIPTFVEENKLVELKKRLTWQGFSPLANGTYAHPSIEQNSLDETLQELKIKQSVVVFKAETLDPASMDALKRLVFEKWNIDALRISYENFLQAYSRIFDSLNGQSGEMSMTTSQAFSLRILLVHEYRRVLLKDHDLPVSMLPDNWNGLKANQLVKRFYTLLSAPSEKYITNELFQIDGLLPAASESFRTRFS